MHQLERVDSPHALPYGPGVHGIFNEKDKPLQLSIFFFRLASNL